MRHEKIDAPPQWWRVAWRRVRVKLFSKQWSRKPHTLLAVRDSAQRLLDAWDAKPPLAWQPENNQHLLEDLRTTLTPNASNQGLPR